ncbi:hypothetical protein E3P96_00877 [Wallemia ichthyophaga]|nr:hypothetical protein E3P96_00877 [Wallemia ichthyophaga]
MAESEGRTKLFQCIHCALVLGDGVAPFGQPIAFSCVTLSCTSPVTDNLEITADRFQSKKFEDYGAVYVWLRCNRCKSLAGRMYKDVPYELEHIRNTFTLDLSSGNVSVYPNSQSDSEPYVEDKTVSEMAKLKGLILMHNEKIRGLQKKVTELKGHNSTLEDQNEAFKKHMNKMTSLLEQDDARLRSLEKSIKKMQQNL